MNLPIHAHFHSMPPQTCSQKQCIVSRSLALYKIYHPVPIQQRAIRGLFLGSHTCEMEPHLALQLELISPEVLRTIPLQGGSKALSAVSRSHVLLLPGTQVASNRDRF